MTDLDLVTAALLQLKPSIKPSKDPVWHKKKPALLVIDCVLSLNRNYDRIVVPRRDQFECAHPQVCMITDLKLEIGKHSSPFEFMQRELNMRDECRAEILAQVVSKLAKIGGAGDDNAQLRNIGEWARKAHFEDYKSFAIHGFALSGFQYLRMLFGADTCKPDLRIRQWVSFSTGRTKSLHATKGLILDIQALTLLTDGAHAANVSVRDVDTTIWELLARGENSKHSRSGSNRACGDIG